MPAQNQKRIGYLGRQSRIARPGISHVNGSIDESITSPYQRRRVQGRAEYQKRSAPSLFGFDPNNRLAWGDIKSKEATNKALDIANLVATKDQMNAARHLMASASFAGELGLE
ncbi:hypothetical protein K3495_g10060 [Podosphaera aphanis]|nr:hypothetical protein K3495_g10060 [Podosphaera aphanis]